MVLGAYHGLEGISDVWRNGLNAAAPALPASRNSGRAFIMLIDASHALRPLRHTSGIPSKPWYAPRTMPMATARLALSPPTMAFALAASIRLSSYFKMI